MAKENSNGEVACYGEARVRVCFIAAYRVKKKKRQKMAGNALLASNVGVAKEDEEDVKKRDCSIRSGVALRARAIAQLHSPSSSAYLTHLHLRAPLHL